MAKTISKLKDNNQKLSKGLISRANKKVKTGLNFKMTLWKLEILSILLIQISK